MAKNDCSTPLADATGNEVPLHEADPLHAAGELFSDIAGTMASAVLVLDQAVQSDAPTALLIALQALLEKTGALADRAGCACGCDPGVQDQDSWLLSPASADGLAVLEYRRNQELAAWQRDALAVRGEA